MAVKVADVVRQVVINQLLPEWMGDEDQLVGDLGADIVDFEEICLKLECEFDIEFPELVTMRDWTVQKLIDYVEQKFEEREAEREREE